MGTQPTNAGIDFQNRISALFVLSMKFDIKVNTFLSIPCQELLSNITFESSDSIDDLVLTTSNSKKIYLQMKRNINLSIDSSSEFYKVCKQFLNQYLEENYSDIGYVLITSNTSSNNISDVLKKILDSIRSSNSLITKEYNKSELAIINKVIDIFKNLYLNIVKKEISEQELLSILKKFYIDCFDIESNQPYEKFIKIMLHNKFSVDSELIWNYLISLSLSFASSRKTITKEYLDNLLSEYLTKSKDYLSKTNFQKIVFNKENPILEVSHDYILISSEENPKYFTCKNKILLLEFFRFTKDQKSIIKYIFPDKISLHDKYLFKIMFRSATFEGIDRFFSKHNSDNKTLIHMILNKEDSRDSSKERILENYLHNIIKTKTNSTCLNCGESIFEKEGFIIELNDSEVENNIGLIHRKCLIPTNRVIGLSLINLDNKYSYLKNFDINLWLDLIKDGQYFFNGASIFKNEHKIALVDTSFSEKQDYMLKIYLEDNSIRYLMKHGCIDRVSYIEGQKFVDLINSNIKTGKKIKNPICYSSKSFVFGSYNSLLENIGTSEEFIECTHSELVKYNHSVALLRNDCQNPNNYYTPLIYLTIDSIPITLSNSFPLFNNPFDIMEYLNSWKFLDEFSHNIIDNFSINIIKNDDEFRLRLLELEKDNLVAAANIKIGKNEQVISSTVFQLQSNFSM